MEEGRFSEPSPKKNKPTTTETTGSFSKPLIPNSCWDWRMPRFRVSYKAMHQGLRWGVYIMKAEEGGSQNRVTFSTLSMIHKRRSMCMFMQDGACYNAHDRARGSFEVPCSVPFRMAFGHPKQSGPHELIMGCIGLGVPQIFALFVNILNPKPQTLNPKPP